MEFAQILRSLNDFLKTRRGLPYCLLALLDSSGWLDWVA
jgi:hypothetical protein